VLKHLDLIDTQVSDLGNHVIIIGRNGEPLEPTRRARRVLSRSEFLAEHIINLSHDPLRPTAQQRRPSPQYADSTGCRTGLR